MSSRTFTVFQDTPSTLPRQSTTSTSSTAISARPSNILQQQSTTLVSSDKENLHPLTGERAGPSTNSSNASKKRKTSVLVAKAHIASAAKESGSTQGDAKKKRKPSTTTTGKSGAKKGNASATKKVAKKPLRRVSPLPKVDEEQEAHREKERERLSQAEIDSRCYELTVQPLADLSEAYEQSQESNSIETPLLNEDKTKFRSIKEPSVEPEIRDCLSTSPQSFSLPPSSEVIPTPATSQSFSTPERKRIYAAFTFTSPSPTSERFRKATRTSSEDSVPRLGLV